MNAMALNFLQHKPSEDWVDFFVNYNKFLGLLQDKEADRKLIEQLFDQFVDQALSVSSSKKKRNDGMDDPVTAEQKADKLWLYAWACAARLGWDLDALLKCSNVIRVFSMVSRLFEHTFNVRGESNILNYVSNLPESAFNSKSAFVTWIYARLVLIIDTQARIPPPPQKPTVSNPNNQVDPALVEAEKINKFVVDVRKHAPFAALHLERLIKLKLDKLEVPTFHCFQQTGQPNGSPTTSKYPNYIDVDAMTFAVRVKLDLMSAHFAAAHFLSAKKWFDEFLPGQGYLMNIHPNLRSLFMIESQKVDGFKKAFSGLSRQGVKKPRLEINPYEFNTQRGSSKPFRTDAGLTEAKALYASANPQIRTSPLYSVLTPEQALVYQLDGPPLWQLIGSFDYTHFTEQYEKFCSWNQKDSNFLDKIFKDADASPIFLKMLDEVKGARSSQVLFFLKQLETLVNGCNLKPWKTYFQTFYSKEILNGDDLWKKYSDAMSYEVLRVCEKISNLSIGYEADAKASEELKKMTKSLAQQAINSVVDKNNASVLESNKWALRLVERPYFTALLNMNLFQEICTIPKVFQNFSSKYLNFARIVATLLEYDKQYEIQWKYLVSLVNKGGGNTSADIALSRENFVEVVRLLKDPKICQYLLQFFVAIYNRAANAGERQTYPYADNLKTNNPEICFVNKQILNLNSLEVPTNIQISSTPDGLEMGFLMEVMELLVRNMLLTDPKSPIFLCQLADLLYAREYYNQAAQLYTTIIFMFEQGLCDSNKKAKIVNDVMIARLVHCFYMMNFCTLAAITGQLRDNVKAHLHYVPSIIRQTPQTTDAGKAYFPYLYSVPLFEAMSEVYEKTELDVYYISILKLCPNRAINQANSANIINEEERRRRSQFIEMIYTTMHIKPRKLPILSEKIHPRVSSEI